MIEKEFLRIKNARKRYFYPWTWDACIEYFGVEYNQDQNINLNGSQYYV